MNYFYMVFAACFAGVLGAMGLGGGGVLIIYLTFIAKLPQLTAQGINLMFFIPIATLAVLIYIKKGQIKIKPLLPYILSALPGAVLGTYIGELLGNGLLHKLFGGALIFLGIKELMQKKK